MVFEIVENRFRQQLIKNVVREAPDERCAKQMLQTTPRLIETHLYFSDAPAMQRKNVEFDFCKLWPFY